MSSYDSRISEFNKRRYANRVINYFCVIKMHMDKKFPDQNKLKRFKRLDELFRTPEGVTKKEILTDVYIDDISKRTLDENIKEFTNVFGAEFDESSSASRGREKLWRYKRREFSIFHQINKDVEIINNTVEKLKSFKGDPRYDYLRFFLLGLKDGIKDENLAMSFDYNQELVGIEHMESLMNAIIHKYPVKLSYSSFKNESITTNFHPYYLKQFNNRWFAFGWSEENSAVFNYPLDRITNIVHLSKKYIPSENNFEEYFDDIIGVTNYEDTPIETIVLRIANKDIGYIRTKPLHWSQTELKERETPDSVYIQIKVKINTELKMLLFSYNDAIEVISPQSLRDEFADKIAKMQSFYQV